MAVGKLRPRPRREIQKSPAFALVAMIGFHVFHPLAMGLNNLVRAFVAAFPPIVFVNQWLGAGF